MPVHRIIAYSDGRKIGPYEWEGHILAATALSFAQQILAPRSCPEGTLWEVDVSEDGNVPENFYFEIMYCVRIRVDIQNVSEAKGALSSLMSSAAFPTFPIPTLDHDDHDDDDDDDDDAQENLTPPRRGRKKKTR